MKTQWCKYRNKPFQFEAWNLFSHCCRFRWTTWLKKSKLDLRRRKSNVIARLVELSDYQVSDVRVKKKIFHKYLVLHLWRFRFRRWRKRTKLGLSRKSNTNIQIYQYRKQHLGNFWNSQTSDAEKKTRFFYRGFSTTVRTSIETVMEELEPVTTE